MARKYATPVKLGVMEGLLAEWHRTLGIVTWLDAMLADVDAAGLSHETERAGIQINGLVQIHQAERKHLARLGVDLMRLGYEERALKATEAQQQALIGHIVAAMKSMGLGDRVGEMWRLVKAQLDGAE